MDGPHVFDLSGPVERSTLPAGDPGIARTVIRLGQLVVEAKRDPRLWKIAWGVSFQAPEKDEHAQAEALFRYVQAFRWRPDPNGIELVLGPQRVLEARAGDCEELVGALSALLEIAGFPTRFYIISRRRDQQFHHILLEVGVKGRWLAADPSEKGVGLGWAPSGITRAWRVGPEEAAMAAVGSPHLSGNWRKRQIRHAAAQRLSVLAGLGAGDLDFLQKFTGGLVSVDQVVAQTGRSSRDVAAVAKNPLVQKVVKSPVGQGAISKLTSKASTPAERKAAVSALQASGLSAEQITALLAQKQSEGLPLWAWGAIALGGVVVVGGLVWLIKRKRK